MPLWRREIVLLIASGAFTSSRGTPLNGTLQAGDIWGLGACVDNSWLRQLAADPQQSGHAPNKQARQVFSGHYVNVLPTPLADPYLVICSSEVAQLLGLSVEECQTEGFASVFSGNVTEFPPFQSSWATPYALSIYGQEMVQNCPFGTGNGYGDGRAISLAEVCGRHEHCPWSVRAQNGRRGLGTATPIRTWKQARRTSRSTGATSDSKSLVP
mmetsp:Transcript_160057/g.513505  ORF Transcript_160057/g.513505 Transcript_160057/m.513505 type:complete len:213 (+) Transcript_160057:71-709(+)